MGYAHRFLVDVYGTDVTFERDEEGSYRPIVDAKTLPRDMDVALLQAIAQAIEDVLK